MILEARCGRCSEIFNPHSEEPADLEHGIREDGEECGGLGEILGAWGGCAPHDWLEGADGLCETCGMPEAEREANHSPADEGPGSPCPRCDSAAFTDESGCCIHCGEPRRLPEGAS